jgi:hypothetical protein
VIKFGLIAVFFLPVLLYAQNSGYSLDTSGGEPRFTQRLSWTGDEYVSRYEVVIEKEEGGGFREMRRESTTALFIDVSLVPGKYRCYVIPYDFLGQPGGRTVMFVDVLAALNPELDDPLVEFVYSDNDPLYEMNISGRDIVPGADIYLRGSGGKNIVPSRVRINGDGSEVNLLFDKEQLLPGNYELFVRNPGGLETYSGVTVEVRGPAVPGFADGSQKKLTMFLVSAWMPSVTIYDKGERLFDDVWSPAGQIFRLGIISAKPGAVNMGAELTGAWSVFYDGSAGRATHFDSAVNFLMRKWSHGGKTAVTFRLGIGYSLPLSGHDEDPSFTDLLYSNIGVSLPVFVNNVVYLEGGIDYAHWFSGPFSGHFRPWGGVGLRF